MPEGPVEATRTLVRLFENPDYYRAMDATLRFKAADEWYSTSVEKMDHETDDDQRKLTVGPSSILVGRQAAEGRVESDRSYLDDLSHGQDVIRECELELGVSDDE